MKTLVVCSGGLDSVTLLGHDRTTTEVISQWLYDCSARWPVVVAVRVSKTPHAWGEFRP